MKTRILHAVGIAAALMNPAMAQSQEESDDAHHEIDQIIVTATPLSRTVEELAQPTTVLHGEELAKKQSASIGETLSQEPGLSSTYFGPVSSRPVIRGQFGERVRVLTNGLDSLDASALSEDHQATVEGLLAQRIEIVRGPATLLYGSGAAGGLVNVVDSRLAEDVPDEIFSGALALGTNSAVGMRDAAIRAQYGAGNVVVSADYFVRSTDNVDIPGFAESSILRGLEAMEGGGEEEGEEAFGVVENTDSDTDGGALGVSLLADRGYLGVSVSKFNSEYGVPGHHHEDEGGAGEEEEIVRIDLDQTRVDAKGEYDIDGDLLAGIRFRAAVNDYTHTELEGAEIGTVFDVRGTDGRVELRHAPLGQFEGAIGLQYKRIDFDAIGDEAFVPASETKRVSLFVYEELKINDAFVLQGSARLEDQSITGASLVQRYDDNAFGASLGAVWRPLEDLRISANVALTERHPNSTELYADGPHIAAQRYERGSVTLGNGILQKEHSTNIDLTVHGDNGRLEWSLTGFMNSVEDYILLRPTADEIDELPVFDFDQADVEFRGIEAEALLELLDRDGKHLHLKAFADFVDATEDVSGENLPRIPPRRLGLGLHGGWDRFDASVDAVFAAEQDDVAENELPTDSYIKLDLSLGYTFNDEATYVFVRGSNLLDEDIRQHTSPLKDLVPLPARSIHLGLRHDF